MNVLIVCNGYPTEHALLHRFAEASDMIIAADGGADHLRNAGILPDVITGDMDSCSKHLASTIPVVPVDDQETNDLEKALDLALKRGGMNVKICSATGFRVDQTLKNLSVLLKYNHRFESISIEDDWFSSMVIPKNFSIDVEPGTKISLFPLSGKVDGIFTKGLAYPLNGEPLENGVRDGSSNEAVSGTVEISYVSGHLLLMIGR